MKLNEIRNNPGAHKRKLKVGRGSSSGLGKTSGRGVKGAKARTGTKVYGFEGGQMPLYMRLPKRGFNNIFANEFGEVNLGRIQKAIDEKKIDASKKVTQEVLEKAGIARARKDGIRLLGTGTLKAKLERLIKPEHDSLRYYYLGANWLRRVEHVGAKPAADLGGPLIA